MTDDPKIRKNREQRSQKTMRTASLVVMTAVTVIFTLMVRIPIAPTRGYLNLGDVAIYFTAFIFGPWTALITGGVGTALADILGGYSQWAPLSLLAHGLQGFVVGLLFHRLIGRKAGLREGKTFIVLGMAFLLGTVIMAGIYFLAGTYLMGLGVALVEVPGNILQNGVGILAGTLLSVAVKRAYPPLSQYRW